MVREPRKAITADADLSEREKESLCDLLERWAIMRPSGGTTAISITTTFKAQFFEEAFNRWTSAQEEGTSVFPVEKLNDNLPITPMKRKRGQAEQLDSARARGATALLSTHLNIGAYDVGFLWRAGTFSTINQKYVGLDEGLTMKLAIRRAILNYDQCETARIEQFNKALIIALARLRILACSKTGTQAVPLVDDTHRVNGWIKMVELASDLLLQISANLGEIGRDCVRLRVG
ncbi:hypothetical protein LCI18_004918 [Fusarium solani-melongenae]|uniref:Uncharacterized protein n=1 Tax=Fusarium solani subsp. cucurbitae TaxID=2747967 RepID=A0ACD3YYB8_FUSSC|nr:hypothetical protein LCI18_004918 [Fusarium solani-melongenae]